MEEVDLDEVWNLAAEAGDINPFDNSQREEQDEVPDLSDLLPDENMENGDEPMQEVSALRSGGGIGEGNQQSKETRISRYPTLTYGVQETHTTILPWRMWFAVAKPDHEGPIQMRLRMNSIWDMCISDLATLTEGASVSDKGLYNKPLNPTSAHIANTAFPVVTGSGTQSGERPQWRDYWTQLYEYYTVLGCEWQVTIKNSSNNRGADIIVGTNYDVYSDTSTATGNIMPSTAYLSEALAYKGMKWTTIGCDNSEEDNAASLKVIQGRWKPGMIKRNIINDGDVKTWTKIGTSEGDNIPNLKEILNINFWKAPLAYATSQNVSANCMAEIKYIVQFKDLKQMARYPTDTGTTTTISQVI